MIFSDFVEINPAIKLKAEHEFSFVEMKDLNAIEKFAIPSIKRKLTGGSRFQNGDTLFARITPCLENGKICQVKNLENGVGFGSTEFLVLRGKENISASEFVYYLSRWNEVRNFAVQNMIGTSGRQRVGKEAFQSLELSFPDLKIQKQIASILSSLDDAIELNQEINKTLDAISKTIFKEWFVEFNFPNATSKTQDTEIGKIPAGWKVYQLGDLIDTVSETYRFGNKEKIIFLNTGDILEGEFLHKNYSVIKGLPGQAKKSIKRNDILFSEIRPANKRFAFVDFDADEYVVSTKLMVLRSKKINPLLIYFFLTKEETLKQLQHLAESRSGTFPQITFTQLKELKIVLPTDETLTKFIDILESNYKQINQNIEENKTLSSLRDLLLPKLMKGEIDVKDVL